MESDVVLQLMLTSFGAFGIGHWLSQKEWGTPLRTRVHMFLAYGLFVVGAFSGFFAFLGLVMVAHSKWTWPWYSTLVAGLVCIYGITMVQMRAMGGFADWDNRRTDQVSSAKMEGRP